MLQAEIKSACCDVHDYSNTLIESGKQSVNKRFAVEGLKVVDLFSNTDKPDRDFQLITDRKHDPSFCGAVELGQYYPCHIDRCRELFDLLQRILAGCGIQDKQNLMRRSGQPFVKHPPDLLQLFHQIDFGVKAACRVDNDHIRLF
jgi:hypothetical protein